MQRSGRLLNFTTNQDASATSLGPLFFWYSAWVRLISSFGSHLLSCPKRERERSCVCVYVRVGGGVCFQKSLWEKQQSSSAVRREQHLGSLSLAGGLLEARTIKMT